MKLATSVLFAASLACSGAALAAGGAKSSGDVPGFNELDQNDDGALSLKESRGNPELAKRFKQVDENGDGKLTRMEYLKTMAAKDIHTLREKTAKVIEPDNASSSSAGSSGADKDAK
jgi:Ca2+-binding EF-hand superfamily protein